MEADEVSTTRRLQVSPTKNHRPYIVDLCCLNPKLVIELDGGQHQDAASYDEKRTQFLITEGFQVIRFWDNEVLQHPEDVANSILRALTLRPLPPSATEALADANAVVASAGEGS